MWCEGDAEWVEAGEGDVVGGGYRDGWAGVEEGGRDAEVDEVEGAAIEGGVGEACAEVAAGVLEGVDVLGEEGFGWSALAGE